jgi:hypothetical protein
MKETLNIQNEMKNEAYQYIPNKSNIKETLADIGPHIKARKRILTRASQGSVAVKEKR